MAEANFVFQNRLWSKQIKTSKKCSTVKFSVMQYTSVHCSVVKQCADQWVKV